MPGEHIGQPSGGSGAGVSVVSPGSGASGFSSNQIVIGNNAGALVSATTASTVGFFGAAGSTQPAAYTTAAITTARVFPSTASISTGTGVGGAPFGFTSRADMEALVRVVDSIYRDLTALGLLR